MADTNNVELFVVWSQWLAMRVSLVVVVHCGGTNGAVRTTPGAQITNRISKKFYENRDTGWGLVVQGLALAQGLALGSRRVGPLVLAQNHCGSRPRETRFLIRSREKV